MASWPEQLVAGLILMFYSDGTWMEWGDIGCNVWKRHEFEFRKKLLKL
jgi:hypothetical protein